MMNRDVKSRPARESALLSALGFRRRQESSVPDGVRVYAIGDIHGCIAPLEGLHAEIEADARSFDGEKILVYLGDYVDRGPDSRGVVERLLNGPPEGFSAQYLRGNHEETLLSFLDDAETYRLWRNFGGAETLLSYGLRPPLFEASNAFEEARRIFVATLPGAHRRFMEDLKLMAVIGDYAFVHAGVRPGLSIEDQSEQDLLWIRDEFLSSTRDFGKTIVHGHTPMPVPVSMPNRISVDTGAYATGVLSCVVLEGSTRRFLQAKAA